MTATAAGFELTKRPAPMSRIARDAWRSRDLIAMLAKKDFVARYRRAIFGMAWAIGLPLVQALVLAVVFTRVAKIQLPDYPTFVYTGVLAWSFFNQTLASASTSVVDGQGLATKIYFPRVCLPLAMIGSSLFAFLPGLVTLLVFAAAFGVHIGLRALLLIPAAACLVVLTTAFSLVTSALHVYFRDMKYVVQASLLPWFWASAIFFPLKSLNPGFLKTVIEINPVTGVILFFRAAIVGGDPGWTRTIPWMVAWMAGLFVLAAYLFRRFDRVFVDLL